MDPMGGTDLYIRSVCFSPDGRYLATGAEDKMIRVSWSECIVCLHIADTEVGLGYPEQDDSQPVQRS
jgi:WD40 repeat protein